MTKIKLFLLLLLVLLVVAGLWVNGKYQVVALHPFAGGEDYALRVLTWNVHRSAIVDEAQEREMAQLILAQKADLVQLNEFTLDSCRVLDAVMRQHYPFVEDVNAKTASGDIIYSKRPLFNAGRRATISGSLGVPTTHMTMLCGRDSVYLIGIHMTGNNDSITNRVVKRDRETYYRHFYHLYKERREDRQATAHHLKQWVQASPHPMIIMGDMNDFSVSAPMDSLRDAGLKNAWWEGGFGYGATFKQGWMRLRIDHIYYSEKLLLKNIEVLPTDLSDHFPLVADFSLENESTRE